MEVTAGGRIDAVSDLSLQKLPFSSLFFRIRNRNRIEKRLGIRVMGISENLLCLSHLHDPSQIHHRNSAADIIDSAKSMPYKQKGQMQFLLQAL